MSMSPDGKMTIRGLAARVKNLFGITFWRVERKILRPLRQFHFVDVDGLRAVSHQDFLNLGLQRWSLPPA
jgi:hypothetical protein